MSRSISIFTPTQAELTLVNNVFAVADTQKLGIVTGDAAVGIFSGANLPAATLGEIWALSDHDNNGFLTRKGVAIALRLMGWAQNGEQSINESLLSKPGPLPTIQGVAAVTGITPTSPPPKSPTPSSRAPALPPITADDRAKFMRLFVKCGPVSGLLSGEKARDVFIKSKLPVEKLGQIWNLADTRSRGSLDSTDFAIGMYFIQASMSGGISSIPNSIPPGVYEQASGGKSLESVASHSTGGSVGSPGLGGSFPNNSSLHAQLTGTSMKPQYTGSAGSGILKPLYTGSNAPTASSRLSVASTTPSSFGVGQQPGGWDVTPEEKAGFDRFFDTLDTQRRGFIEGDVAVPFMLQSSLQEGDLAQIWDLADLKNDGRLTKEGFSVAMHLIHAKLAGAPIPEILPQTLIPPSMRSNGHSEITRDLFTFDDSPTSSGPPVESTPSVFAPQHKPQSPPVSGPLTTPFNRNLLDDDDDEHAAPAAAATSSVERGNMQNQLSSTERSLGAAKIERAGIESQVASSASSLAQLESQLAVAKASYDTESRLLFDVRERYAQQSAQIQKTREELITAESDLSALRVEKAEVGGTLLRDRDEVRELQRKMKETNDETLALKKELEKLRKDARHQRGLLAIHKKQLAGVEAERSKSLSEADEARQEVEDAESEVAQLRLDEHPTPHLSPRTNGVLSPRVVPLPETPESSVMSPHSTKSNNPFDRLAFASSSASNTPRGSTALLPFVPTPEPSVPAEGAPQNEDDDFDFFGDDAAEVTAKKESTHEVIAKEEPESQIHVPTPRPQVNIDQVDSRSVSSPEPDFVTPPQSAGLEPTRSESLVMAAETQFPALDEAPTPTDLPPLKEIEHDDDSESSDDEDNVALSDVKDRLQSTSPRRDAQESGTSVSKPLVDSQALSTDSMAASNALDPLHTSNLAEKTPLPIFDPFGMPQGGPTTSATPAISVPTTDLGKDAFGADVFSTPLKSTFGESGTMPVLQTSLASISTADEPKSGTVTDFDEAFGGFGSKAPAHIASGTNSTSFTFDSAFEDDFDFASATNTNPTGLSSTATSSQPNGTSVMSSSPSSTTPIPFFAPFATGAATTAPTDADKGKQPLSFDAAFDEGAAPIESKVAPRVAFDDAFGTSSTASATMPRATSPTSLASPVQSTERATTPPTSTPPRARSPGRASSPSPTASKLSRKESVGSATRPPIEQQSKSSKLHIHFPFGRSSKSKNKKNSMDVAKGSSASAPILPPRNSSTPLGNDDIEDVRTLVNMGFTRAQAVTALEKHGYDVQTALNSLLGS